MKKLMILLLTSLVWSMPFRVTSNNLSDSYSSEAPDAADQAKYDSRYGYNFPTKGKFRALSIFVSIIYDQTPNVKRIEYEEWKCSGIEGVNHANFPEHYFSKGFDNESEAPYSGYFTRFFAESSFESFIFFSDFMTVEIKQSTIVPHGGHFGYMKLMNSVIQFINKNGGLKAFYGNNSIKDYDIYTKQSPGKKQVLQPDSLIDYICFFFKNSTNLYGGLTPISGFGYVWPNEKIKIASDHHGYNMGFVVALGNYDPYYEGRAVVHEIAHSLFGNNSFHTSGGLTFNDNFHCTFLSKQEGYGVFGGALRSCNGYERWRLGWQSRHNPDFPIAATNKNSDIDNHSESVSFLLRDFQSYGDAIRIKLPYKDGAEASNQYIWIENHQIKRNDKLENFAYSEYKWNGCILPATPGIYAYYQVGRDILSSNNFKDVFSSEEKDNLKMISAHGNYNTFYKQMANDCTREYRKPYFIDSTENVLSGTHDMSHAFELPPGEEIVSVDNMKAIGLKSRNGVIYNQFPSLLDAHDVFTHGSVINMSTNPVPVNTTTFYCIKNKNLYPQPTISEVKTSRNTKHIYLNGLSIEMVEVSENEYGKVFKVDIRWDNYDIRNNVKWAGIIVLKEKINILSGSSITLNQNMTPVQLQKDSLTGLFAPRTHFICSELSLIEMESNSKLLITEKSIMEIQNRSSLSINGGQITIRSGSTMTIRKGAMLLVKNGGQIFIERGGTLDIEDKSSITTDKEDSIVYV